MGSTVVVVTTGGGSSGLNGVNVDCVKSECCIELGGVAHIGKTVSSAAGID